MRHSVRLCLAIVLFVVAASYASAAETTVPDDVTQLRQLQHDYVTAVDTLDPVLIERIWSHSPTVCFIHPLGTDIGLKQIEEDLYSKIMGLFSKRDLILENPSIEIYGDAAWSHMTWTFHATFKSSGKAITTQGRETQIYHKENGVWRLVHVHYSGLPMAAPTGF